MYTIAVILVIAWLLGFLGGYQLNGLIHLLLVLAVISVLIRVIQGRSL
ncbi:lmo0937 family membrane protein [Vampirovibrio sp.]